MRELVEIDALHAKPPEAALARLLQVLRTAVARYWLRARALEPPLGGDHQAGIRIQGLGDQVLVTSGP